MKRNYAVLAFSLVLSVLLCNCKKDDLPHNGSNTFHCKIDGKYWEAADHTDKINNVIYPPVSYWRGKFIISEYYKNNYKNVLDEFTISLVDYWNRSGSVNKQGVYSLTDLNAEVVLSLQDKNAKPVFFTNVVSGSLTLNRLDSVADIYSGTFQMTLQNAATGQVIQITDGVFDLKGY